MNTLYKLVQQMEEDGQTSPVTLNGLHITCQNIHSPDTMEWLKQVQEKNVGLNIFWKPIQ